MKLRVLIGLSALPPVSALAGIVLYTDSQHLPDTYPADITVVMLDGPERLQTEIFGHLAASPEQAAARVRQVMASPDWQQKQQQLAESYRQVVHAWETGVRKVPAVVFDDRDVVYGTTDVARAVVLRQQAGGER